MSKKGKGKGKDLKQVKSKGARPKPNYSITKPLDETTKQFYMWQISSLEERNTRFQKELDDIIVNESQKHERILQKLADKTDMIGFLKADVQNKIDAYNDLNDKYISGMHLLDVERHSCYLNLEKMRKETDEAYALLYAENVKLVSKLTSLEEFFANKASITRRLVEAESKIEKMEAEHKTTVLDMEKNFIIAKQRLKAEMIQRIKRVAAEFRKVTKNSQSTTFRKTSAENSELRSKLASVSDKFELLIRENELLSESLYKAVQVKEFATSDTKILFEKYDLCLESLQSCKQTLLETNNKLIQAPLDYADYEKVQADNVRLENELAETKMKLADLSSRHEALSRKSLQQELLHVLDSKKRQELEGMLSNAIVAIKEAVANMVPRKNTEESVKRRSTKSLRKQLRDKSLEEQLPLTKDAATEVELSGSTHFAVHKFRSNQHSTVSFKPFRASIASTNEPDTEHDKPSASITLIDQASSSKQEVEKLHSPKIHFLSAQGSKLDFTTMSEKDSHQLLAPKPSVSQSVSSSGSHTTKITRKYQKPLKKIVSLSSELLLSPTWSKSHRERFTDSPSQDVEQRLPRELKKSVPAPPCLSVDEITPIQSKILESLAIVVKSAIELGVQLPAVEEEKPGQPHTISFVPDLPRYRIGSQLLRNRSGSKSFKGSQLETPRHSLKQANSLTLEDVDATTAVNLAKLRDALCQNYKPQKTCNSNVQVYTKEDMLEYLLVLLDSASHLGAGVQQSQLDVLWQHATGESSAPKMGFLNRNSQAHYLPGDLGVIPRGKSTAVHVKRKLKRIRLRDDPERFLRFDDKAVQTLSIPQMIANITMEEKVKYALRNEQWNNQPIGGLASNRVSYDDDCCNKTPACSS